MILLIYSNGAGRGKADDGETARANLGDGAGVLWWSSDSDGND
jgi:hypothetical protein